MTSGGGRGLFRSPAREADPHSLSPTRLALPCPRLRRPALAKHMLVRASIVGQTCTDVPRCTFSSPGCTGRSSSVRRAWCVRPSPGNKDRSMERGVGRRPDNRVWPLLEKAAGGIKFFRNFAD